MKYEVRIDDDFVCYVDAGNPYQAGLLGIDEHIEVRHTVPNPRGVLHVQNLETNAEQMIPFVDLLEIRILANQNLTYDEIHSTS